jgi:hemoglobin
MTYAEVQPLSLYQRFGGKAAVDAVVELLYERVLADPVLRPFFEDVDGKAQAGKQHAFLTHAFGGPTHDTAKDLRSGHAHLVERGLGEEHFDAFAGHLADTLAELGLPLPLIAEVMQIAAATHDDVLGL